MAHKRYNYTRLACAYFFFGCGLAYGIFTSRLPAYRANTGASDSDIGLLLLVLGLFSLLALSTCAHFIQRFGLSRTLGTGFALMLAGYVATGLPTSPLGLAAPLALTGLGTGICDVGMNAAGIETEQRFKVHCMAFLHASFSLGGVIGAVAGSAFAAVSASPLFNALLILCPYLLLLPWATGHLLPDSKIGRQAALSAPKPAPGRLPLFVFFIGALTALCYMAEGSVAEWGSLFLHTDKGASPQMAALVFGSFCVPMVIGRLLGDSLRDHFGDVPLLCAGASLGATGLAVAVFSPWVPLCLCGYALMGMGMAPVVPILFSRAGSLKGVNVPRAVSAVSTMAYSGLLFFPPLLGFLGNAFGLGTALLIPLAGCVIVAAGSLALRQKG